MIIILNKKLDRFEITYDENNCFFITFTRGSGSPVLVTSSKQKGSEQKLKLNQPHLFNDTQFFRLDNDTMTIIDKNRSYQFKRLCIATHTGILVGEMEGEIIEFPIRITPLFRTSPSKIFQLLGLTEEGKPINLKEKSIGAWGIVGSDLSREHKQIGHYDYSNFNTAQEFFEEGQELVRKNQFSLALAKQAEAIFFLQSRIQSQSTEISSHKNLLKECWDSYETTKKQYLNLHMACLILYLNRDVSTIVWSYVETSLCEGMSMQDLVDRIGSLFSIDNFFDTNFFFLIQIRRDGEMALNHLNSSRISIIEKHMEKLNSDAQTAFNECEYNTSLSCLSEMSKVAYLCLPSAQFAKWLKEIITNYLKGMDEAVMYGRAIMYFRDFHNSFFVLVNLGCLLIDRLDERTYLLRQTKDFIDKLFKKDTTSALSNRSRHNEVKKNLYFSLSINLPRCSSWQQMSVLQLLELDILTPAGCVPVSYGTKLPDIRSEDIKKIKDYIYTIIDKAIKLLKDSAENGNVDAFHRAEDYLMQTVTHCCKHLLPSRFTYKEIIGEACQYIVQNSGQDKSAIVQAAQKLREWLDNIKYHDDNNRINMSTPEIPRLTSS